MHSNSMRIMQRFLTSYLPSDKRVNILDLGSQIIGTRNDISYRKLMREGWSYTGADIVEGRNVHVIVRPYDFPFPDNEWDVIISGQTLEHMEHPWLWFEEVARVLAFGGFLCVIAPAVWQEHRHPIDTYRYYPDGMRALAAWAGLKVIECERTPKEGKVQDTYIICTKGDGWKKSSRS